MMDARVAGYFYCPKFPKVIKNTSFYNNHALFFLFDIYAVSGVVTAAQKLLLA